MTTVSGIFIVSLWLQNIEFLKLYLLPSPGKSIKLELMSQLDDRMPCRWAEL